jgi:hypothetical protein
MIDASGVTVARQLRDDRIAGRARKANTAMAPAATQMLVSHARSVLEIYELNTKHLCRITAGHRRISESS